MSKRMIRVSLLVLALIVGLQAQGAAQAPADDKGTVTGQGTVELKRQPEILRVQVEVLAKSKDLKEALAKLKDRRQAVHKQLEKLGVAKDTVVFSEPVLTPEKTDRQRQMEMMIQQRLNRSGKKKDTKAKEPEAVVISATLKAEFPLNAKTPEDVLLIAQDLQDKIKAADLAGLKELKQLSPQEEELAEEAGNLGGFREDGEPQRGEPQFLFVSKISEEEYNKALAEAYQKAKREAGRLAKAAGTELGALHHLDNTSQTANENDDSPAMYNRTTFYRGRYTPSSTEDQPREAIGFQSGKATFRVTISASFVLKKPGN